MAIPGKGRIEQRIAALLIRRRDVIAFLGTATATWPMMADAQQSGKKTRIGTLGFLAMPASVARAFSQGIAEFSSGEIVIEQRDVEGRPELFPERAAELVRLNVDVIFARGPAALVAAKDATTNIPIVAVDFESDPVAKGFVKTLGRPGGNITGMFLDLPELIGKQMELLKEAFPQITRVAILGNPGINAPQFAASDTAAQTLTVQPERIELRTPNDIETALETVRAKHAEAAILLSSPLVFARGREIGEVAVAKRLPVISLFAEFPRAGGFMAYGPSLPESFRRCGAYVGRIVQGANPVDLPIQRPDRFELAINVKTAKALGLVLPPSLLARADEVIE
jgi:putative ABC transport system substrate-binding protein